MYRRNCSGFKDKSEQGIAISLQYVTGISNMDTRSKTGLCSKSLYFVTMTLLKIIQNFFCVIICSVQGCGGTRII